MGSIQDGSDDVWGKADPIDHAGDVGIGDAFLADVSMLVLGGDLKRREKLSARFGGHSLANVSGLGNLEALPG